MKKVLSYLIYGLLRFGLSLRYRIQVKGFETLTKQALNKPGGTLILANHPAEVDPGILLSVFWPRFKPHPVAIDYLFYRKGVRFLLDLVGALPVPDFEESANSYKRLEIERTYKRLFSYLSNKECLLIYPAGALKSQAEEYLGGTSGVHYILQKEPDTNIILVRSTGLWGSSWSRAPTGKTPDIIQVFFHGLKVILKNGIFFAPRRKVLVECMPAPADFPWKGTRREINKYLEDWYNAPGPEPLNLVSFSRWRKVYPKIHIRPESESISYEDIPEDIQQHVIEEIKQLTRQSVAEITPDMQLAVDLGLDSLDMAQLVIMLKEDFGVSDVHSTEMKTVGSVMAFAAGLKKSSRSSEEIAKEKHEEWEEEKNRPGPHKPEGATLVEAFLRSCDRMGKSIACVDSKFGEVSYRKMKLASLALSRVISRLNGQRIGIMMPASVAVNIVILATRMAKKIPVMINWTLGPRNLKAVAEQSQIKNTISAWSFLDRLESVELDGIDEQIVLLEELRRQVKLRDRLWAFLMSFFNANFLMKLTQCEKIKEDDLAVILFTSGTESFPKGVPLTHRNILANQRSAYDLASVGSQDVLLGALPPFHSFGFSVTGLFPLLAGIRVVFTPNPTDGRRMALVIAHWKVTFLCLAPTFFKYLLRSATRDQLRSLRLIVLGAEKTPPELYTKMEQLNEHAKIIEGYGITECAPILTLNPPESGSGGVGYPLPNVELLIVNPETKVPVKDQQAGLILARGPNVFSGYLDPKLPSPFIRVLDKNWYQTGDLGYFDESGSLHLEGRLKRFIKIGGEMISLTAIEDVLIAASVSHDWDIDPDAPSIAVCATEEGGKRGEIHLFTTFSTTIDEVNEELRKQGMSNLIRISSVKQLPAIPLLGTGKVNYRALASQLDTSLQRSTLYV